MTFIYDYAQKFCDHAYYLMWGYVLDATPTNLQWLLTQNPDTILEYTFKKGYQTYTPLEFAIVCQDAEAAKLFIDLGAKLDFSGASSTLGNILHFYLECLQENIPPNLELLNLLLDHHCINAEEGESLIKDEAAGPFVTPLEFALDHMSQFEKIHWDVIEILLARDSRIDNPDGDAPFTVLKNADNHKIRYGTMDRTYEEEIRFLDHLVCYLALEKKYHPDSDSSLTLKEFKFHTSRLQSMFLSAAVSIDTTSFISQAVGSFISDLEELKLEQEEADVSEEDLAECKGSVREGYAEMERGLYDMCGSISSAFCIYHKYFKALVSEGSFGDCFETWQLNSIIPSMKKSSNLGAQGVVRLLPHWGIKV